MRPIWRRAAFGVLTGPVGIDMAVVRARKDAVSKASRDGVEGWLRGMTGCTVFKGHARFEAPDMIRIGDDLLVAPRVFLNGADGHGCRPCPGSTS